MKAATCPLVKPQHRATEWETKKSPRNSRRLRREAFGCRAVGGRHRRLVLDDATHPAV